MSPTREQLDEVLRQDFMSFVMHFFSIINPGTKLSANWAIKSICYELEQVALGKTKKLIICAGPRSGKSTLASVLFPAFVLGHNPDLKVIAASYADKLSSKFSRDFRRVIDHPDYKRLFPKLKTGRKATETEFETTLNGGRFATSVGATMVGMGANVLVVDDPITPEEVASETRRENVNEWFFSTAHPRLNDKRRDAVVIVTHRVHENDLIGRLTEEDDHEWRVVTFPAFTTEPMTYQVGENEFYERKAMEVIDPARETLKELKRIEKDSGSLVFMPIYQQQPTPREGNIIKRGWLKYCETVPANSLEGAVIQSWDTASEAGELNDYSVCITAKVNRGRLILLNTFRRKMDFPTLHREARRLALDYDANLILIEKAASGSALRQQLNARLEASVRAVVPKGQKVMRLVSVSHLIEDGKVFIPRDATWRGDFEKELLTFPNGKHDDQVDALSQLLQFVKSYKLAVLENWREGTTLRRSPERRTLRPNRPKSGERAKPIALFGVSEFDVLKS